MAWKKRVGPWLLQICTTDVWPCCRCGYLYFYDTMRLMECELSGNCQSLSLEETFSLAAACLLKSFQALNRDDPGVLTLLYLLVHRLRRMERLVVCVTVSSIKEQMENISTVHMPEEDIAMHEEGGDVDELFYLDLMDLIEGKQNVGRPLVQTKHDQCWSQHLGIASQVIESELLKYASEAIVSRLSQGTSTDTDKRLWREVTAFHPSAKLLRHADERAIELVHEILIFRTIADFSPWKSLLPMTLHWRIFPKDFWNSKSSDPCICFWRQA